MAIDLSPAKWIWLPSTRCLPNTFVLFRKEVTLANAPSVARGWITADSRYRLTINGQRVQWGPSPCDPRWLEADPMDLLPWLGAGANVIGVEVCYFGHGDGTWPLGSPGLIFRLELDGQLIVSDHSWLCLLDRAHRPGMYKRSFLRALQEEFDARKHPNGWDMPDGTGVGSWLPARELPGEPTMPAVFAGGPEYNLVCDTAERVAGPEEAETDQWQGSAPKGLVTHHEQPALVARAIPLMREVVIPARSMTDCGRVRWLRDPDDWFESRMPGCLEAVSDASVVDAVPSANEGLYFTYEMEEQAVGFPQFQIEAEAGAIVDLMVVESHDPIAGPKWLDTYYYHWSRFICRAGTNVCETFDYESFKWMQIHVRNTTVPFRISAVGFRRRLYAWPNEPHVGCSEAGLQRLFDAAVNTVRNCALETNQDGGGRERQQYSGDVGHTQHAVRYAFGEIQHGARYLDTYSQGMTLDGYFLDCWPAFDRLARIAQRQVGTTEWGPLLDHGVGFNFDCWNHYMESGDREALRRPYPRLKRFAAYLQGIVRDDNLLPVEDIGVPAVWIDHSAYRHQSHKRCAFNLYAAAMFQHAYAPIAELFGDEGEPWRKLGRDLEAAAIARFWEPERGIFVAGENRLCDRSLATAILFNQCPGGNTQAALRALVECPPEMGLSYPANAVWRYWALAKMGRADVVLQDFRARWATMPSVLCNNTLQESWVVKMDETYQFSHCPLAPLILLFQSIAGIRPTKPGFTACEIRPQLADLADLDLIAHTSQGPIWFVADACSVTITVPETCEAVLVLTGDKRRPFSRTITLDRQELTW